MLDYLSGEVPQCHDGVMMNRSVWLVDNMAGCMSEGRHRRGLEEGSNGDWWRRRVWGLNLANGSSGVELILFALELSGLRIRELCLYARHLLSIMMSHSGSYHVFWEGVCELADWLQEWMKNLVWDMQSTNSAFLLCCSFATYPNNIMIIHCAQD